MYSRQIQTGEAVFFSRTVYARIGFYLITATRFCHRCGSDQSVRLVRNITANGASQVYWEYLRHIGNIKPAAWISHKDLKDGKIDIEGLPVIENYSNSFKCVVCGEYGCELHHFAPVYLFGDDAEKWPKEYLCRKHHAEWHSLVTPHMSMRTK